MERDSDETLDLCLLDDSVIMEDDFWLVCAVPDQPDSYLLDTDELLPFVSLPPAVNVNYSESWLNGSMSILEPSNSYLAQPHRPGAKRFRWPPLLDRALACSIIETESMNWEKLSRRLTELGHDGITSEYVRLHIFKKTKTMFRNIDEQRQRGSGPGSLYRRLDAFDWLLDNLYRVSLDAAPDNYPFQIMGDVLYSRSIGHSDRLVAALYDSINRAVEVDAIYAIAYVWMQFKEDCSLQEVLCAFRTHLFQQRLQQERMLTIRQQPGYDSH